MRILITGGAGQLGKALQAALSGDAVFPFDLPEMDITDEDVVRRQFREVKPEIVIHAAAWTDTAACERDPRQALAVNAEGSRLVAEACRETGAAMMYVSTNEVFDGEKGAPYVEDDAPNPLNEYARSKLEGERRVQATLDRHCIVRTSWLYGPGRVSFPEKIVQAARERGALKVVTDETASPTWTVDLAQAIAKLVRQPAYGVYHLTNSGACSRKEFAEEILRLAGISVPVEAATQAEFGAPYRKPVDSTLANTRAAALGITLRPWPEALADHFRHPESGLNAVESASRQARN